jgi:predicted NBD/HSP70 family sugar kinase
MHLLGLDISAGRVIGVVVDGDGTVVRRARRDGNDANADDVTRELAEGLSLDAYGVCAEQAADVARVKTLKTLKNAPEPRVCTPGAAAVTAEGWAGAAREARHAVCLNIGDRVFAGILLDGKLWPGAHGLAGSAAWLALNPVERQDYRKFGNLAAEVSSQGIARRLSWRIQAGDHSDVLERAGDLQSITAAHVYEGARTGDGLAISVVRDTARYIGMALANLALSLDPDVVILGGDAVTAGDLLLEPVRQEYLRRVPPGMVDQVRFAVSPFGDDGVAIGAARLAALAGA